MFSDILVLPRQVKALLLEGLNRPRKGTDAGDHPPITPMRSASEAERGASDNSVNNRLLNLNLIVNDPVF